MKRTKNKRLKLFLLSFVTILLISMKSHSASAQEVKVTLPTFDITINDVEIENEYRKYPFIVYKNITYFPMTWTDSRFLGLKTKWDRNMGLEVIHTGEPGNYKEFHPDLQTNKSAKIVKAKIPPFNIKINGKEINNSKEKYPLLFYKNITYFPLTWRFAVDEFDWDYHFSHKEGLKINSFNILYEKFKSIKVGESTRGEVEKLLGQKLIHKKIGIEYDPYHGFYEVKSDKDTLNVTLDPVNPAGSPDQVVVSKSYNPHYSKQLKHYQSYPQVTEENFKKLENNMSYESVSAILGGEGNLAVENVNDREGHVRYYRWHGEEHNIYIDVHFKKVGNEFVITDKFTGSLYLTK